MATKRISIALILSAALATMITLLLVAFALLAYKSEKSSRWEQLKNVLTVSAEQLTVGLSFPIWNLDDKQTYAVMKSSMSNREIQTVVTTFNKKHFILTRDEKWQIVQKDTAPADNDQLLTEKRTIYFGNEPIGQVSIHASPKFFESELQVKRISIIVLILVLATVLVSGLYLLLWHIILKPLKAVGQYATGVKAGHSVKVAPQNAWFFGELKTLNESIREMIELIDSRFLAMKESEERLQLATRAASIGIWDWDVAHDRLTWDDEMFRIYGIPKDHSTSSFEIWKTSLLADDRDRAMSEIAAALQGEQEFTTEFKIRWPDGSIHFIQADSQTFRDSDGKAIRMVGINYDISERKRAELALKEYKENLEDLVRQRTSELKVALDTAESATRAKSKFLANMSHELRTPLNAVIGFSELMSNSQNMNPEEKNNLRIINRSGHHLLTLINTILELSKIEADQMQLVVEITDLGDLLNEVMDMVRVRAEKARLKLHLECGNLPQAVSIDGGKLRQVLLNLLSNAVKFVAKGSITLSVHATGVGENQVRLDFAVRDTGIGIAPEDQARIFEPFIQADSPSTQAGTGLGLTISRDFVRLLGGELKLESSLGKGSTFHFSLTVQQQEKLIRPAVAANRVIGLPINEQGRLILAVDDNQDARQLLTGLLCPLGFVVKEARDGIEAQTMLATLKPDLIFMDYRMPNMDGLEATRWIRAQSSMAQPRIVMLTASAFEDERQGALNAGADDFMRKPVQQDKLHTILEQQLGLHFIRKSVAQDTVVPEAAVLGQTDLAQLGQPVRIALKNALHELNMAKAAEILQSIEQDLPELAQRIRTMMDQFQYPQLWKLLDEIESGKGLI